MSQIDCAAIDAIENARSWLTTRIACVVHCTYLNLKMLHLRVDIVSGLVEQHDIDRRLEAGPDLHELKLSPAQAIGAFHQRGDQSGSLAPRHP